ncbi:hypothetical protein HWV62_27168 [Athelia sp. TMB]|nr:hypothetical protein HWV62_27168 [Athelia sp. TMB]
MSDPLNSFEPLVPVPFKHTPSPRSSTPQAIPNPKSPATLPPAQNSAEEPEIDKFATLFNPSTPRASPTLPPIFSEARPTSSIRSNSSHRLSQNFGHTRQDTSNDSDFGGFVSVPPAQDPLSQTLCEMPPSGSALAQASAEGQAIFSQLNKRASNSSSDIFGQFVDGTESRGKGKGYLDELLKHEEDPLYWINDGGSDPVSGTPSRGEESEYETGHIGTTVPLEVSLLDLDLDSDNYFARNSSGDSELIPSTQPPAPVKPKPKPFATPSMSPTFPFAPRHPASLSTNSGTSSSAPSPSSSPPIPTSTSPRPAFATQPSRWMSTLLSNPRTSLDEQSHPTVQGIFPSLGGRSSSTDALQQQIRHPSPQVQPQYSLPASVSVSSTISHGTPFASRSYVPPSGAPGYSGNNNSWDKGFSDDFDKEGNKTQRHVRLEGLREATEGILDMTMVEMIRPHLPALARLPRKWTLLYSLDQHGISLNTLYTRCEPQGPSTSHPRGSLVVIKDSGDTIFGVWLGEGVRVSKGYYGSGESFLWRYAHGNLDVFRWTGKNEYVAHCEPEYLSFGGGDGHYGLYLDDTLLEGSSACCPTFANEPLCSPGSMKGGNVPFECVGLEVWAVGNDANAGLSPYPGGHLRIRRVLFKYQETQGILHIYFTKTGQNYTRNNHSTASKRGALDDGVEIPVVPNLRKRAKSTSGKGRAKPVRLVLDAVEIPAPIRQSSSLRTHGRRSIPDRQSTAEGSVFVTSRYFTPQTDVALPALQQTAPVFSRKRKNRAVKNPPPILVTSRYFPVPPAPVPVLKRTTSRRIQPITVAAEVCLNTTEAPDLWWETGGVPMITQETVARFKGGNSFLYYLLWRAKPTLIQEQCRNDTWKLLVAVTFLNKTNGKVAIPVFWEVIRRWPNASSLSSANEEEVVEVIRPLGLQNARAKRLILLSQALFKNPPVPGAHYRPKHIKIGLEIYPGTSISNLPGSGAYALDSYRIFHSGPCNDPSEWKLVMPKDKELRRYLVCGLSPSSRIPLMEIYSGGNGLLKKIRYGNQQRLFWELTECSGI